MKAELGRASLDLGIVTTNFDAMYAFYCDVLGCEFVAKIPVPGVGHVTRLKWGESYIKMLVPDRVPAAVVPPGGLSGATGYRYCTLTIVGIEDFVRRCRQAGAKVPVDARELRPGVKVALVEDPDGNTIELMQES